MLKGSSKQLKMMNFICMALMLVVLILQFVPFWSANGKGISISSYIWFPIDNETNIALGDSFKATFADYNINSIVLVAVGQLVAGVIGVVLSVVKRNNPFIAIAPIICGIFGVWAFIAKPVYRLGTAWGLHLAVDIILLVVAIYTLVINIRSIFVTED